MEQIDISNKLNLLSLCKSRYTGSLTIDIHSILECIYRKLELLNEKSAK